MFLPCPPDAAVVVDGDVGGVAAGDGLRRLRDIHIRINAAVPVGGDVRRAVVTRFSSMMLATRITALVIGRG
jgi:hypothetical protein